MAAEDHRTTDSGGALLFIQGRPHSPHIIFFKHIWPDDSELIARLGLETHVETKDAPSMDDRICVGSDGTWTHLVNNWRSTLFSFESVHDAFKELASQMEVFWFAHGDACNSFEFELHKDGALTRKVSWDAPNYTGGYLKEETGEALEARANASTFPG